MNGRSWLVVILMLLVIGCSSNEEIEVGSGSENQGAGGEQAGTGETNDGQIVIAPEINGGGDQDSGYKATVD